MALVDSVQVKKSVTNTTNVWHTVLTNLIEGIVLNQIADGVLISSHTYEV
jgi:hypothetical protein